MLISEMIAQLEAIKAEKGDCEVYINNDEPPKLGFNAVAAPINHVYYTRHMHSSRHHLEVKSLEGVLIE